MDSFCFCETYLPHIKLFVGNQGVISPFLGGGENTPPFENFQKEGSSCRTEEKKWSKRPQKVSRKAFKLDQSCLVQHNALGLMFAQFAPKSCIHTYTTKVNAPGLSFCTDFNFKFYPAAPPVNLKSWRPLAYHFSCSLPKLIIMMMIAFITKKSGLRSMRSNLF